MVEYCMLALGACEVSACAPRTVGESYNVCGGRAVQCEVQCEVQCGGSVHLLVSHEKS